MGPLLQNVIVLFLANFPVCMYAYANGMVTDACNSMFPNHGASAQTSSPPYTLSLEKYNYTAGDKIKVTLSPNSGASQFKGFLIQARSGSSTVPLGSFEISNSNTQTLTCTSAASSVSHTSGSGKSSIVVTWVAPTYSTADIQIKATVVQTGTVFWTNVTSEKIAYIPTNSVSSTTVANPSTGNTTASTTASTVTTTTTSKATTTTSKPLNSQPSGSNSGVQHSWSLEGILLSGAIMIASFLA